MKRRDRIRFRKNAARRRPERRGVLLLVVLSMLVLFLLLGTTFLLTSGQYRTASKIVEKSHRTTFQPADLLERALMQLVRDTNNSSSVIRYHSLLRDMYGVNGFMARVNVAATIAADPSLTPVPPAPVATPSIGAPHYAGVTTATATTQPRGTTEGQVVEFYVLDAENQSVLDSTDANAVGLDIDANGMPANHTLAKVNGYYEGCVLTFTTGPCRGSSVRVIDYEYRGAGTLPRTVTDPGFPATSVGPVGRFRVLVPRRVDGRSLTITNGVITDLLEGTQGSRFIVNGRPFSGAGVGLNPLAMSSANPVAPMPRLSALELFGFDGTNGYGLERALIPNPIHYFETANVFLSQTAGVDPWARPYTGQELRPLTRNFVFSSDIANYNPQTSPLYKTFAGPGDTNESYDAPDTQNMAMAMQSLEPRLRGRVVNAAGVAMDPDVYYPANAGTAPAYLDLEGVTIPSFHRPELANFWFHRFWKSSWLQGIIPDANDRVRAILEPYDANGAPQHGLNAAQAAQIALLKRKFLLRPLREDHPSFDGSNPLSTYGTTALRNALNSGALVNAGTNEITFPYWEAVGPWDVDNDGDGVNDSVWVDIGLPVQQTEDGRWYKPLVAMLVEDLDGRLNLNAHGSEADMVQADLDASQRVDVSGGVINQFNQNLAQDYNNNQISLRSSNQLPGGVGWGVAETSLRPIFSPTLPMFDVMNGSALAGDAQYDDYARTLYGRPDPSTAGRTPSFALRESVAFGRYGSLPGTAQAHDDALAMQLRYSLNYNFAGGLPATASSLVSLTKPGITFPIDPAVTAPATRLNTLAAVRDPRTPLEFLGYPRYTGAETQPTDYEALSGFSSAPDLGGRYAAGLSGAGASVDEPRSAANVRSFPTRVNAQLSWRELAASAVDDSPYELDLSIGARNRPPASLDDVRRSYDPNLTGAVQTQATPISDDAPFSAAELERILRAFDGDAQKLPDRLWKAVDAFDPVKKAAANRLLTAGNDESGYTPQSLDLVVAGAEAAVTRRQVTTDSWDLPVPNENLYDRLLLGADGAPGVPLYWSVGWAHDPNLPRSPRHELPDDDGDTLVDEGDEAITFYDPSGNHTFAGTGQVSYRDLYNAGCDDYVVIMWQDPPKQARLIDYLKYRVTLELLRKGVIAYPPAGLTPPQIVDYLRQTYHPQIERFTAQVLFGGELAAANPAGTNAFGGLIAPELIAGRRMDLNRPFGDGRDNNNNGVVDEVEEAGEPFADLNGNNRWDTNEPYLDLDLSGDYTSSQDYLWVDANGDGIETPDERRPFRHVPLHETFVDRSGVRIYNPQMARQLYARHLYCLMLALMDDNYLAPYDAEDMQSRHYIDPLSGYDNGVMAADASEACRIANELHGLEFGLVPPSPAGTTPVAGVTPNHTLPLADADLEKRRLQVLNRARQMAMRELTCRRIAQWAINVVDYRDPDSIQTPFEYDENPWDGWNVTDRRHDRTYPLDGDLATDENRTMVRPANRTATNTNPPQPTWFAPQREFYKSAATPANPLEVGQAPAQYFRGGDNQFLPDEMLRIDQSRGVVWGGERPEVLLTEGVAWHDRRLEDLVSTTKVTIEGQQVPEDGELIVPTKKHSDDDLDQLRKPKGFAFLEAYNPHVGDDQRPAELYRSYNGNSGVQLDLLSAAGVAPMPIERSADNDPLAPALYRSPVWRIAVVEEHPLIRNATLPLNNDKVVGQAADDPPTKETAANNNEYLGDTIANGPWVYESDSDFAALNAPFLPNSYRQFFAKKRTELGYALETSDAYVLGNQVTDADGIGVSAGVIERAPTIPDTAFPTFDSFAQPFDPKRIELSISSKTDARDRGGRWPGQGFISRGTLRKPNTYLERVFYMAPAAIPARRYNDTTERWPTAKITDPGLRIPLLTYDVPANYSNNNTVKQWGAVVGAAPRQDDQLGGMLRVYASKFANAYNRLVPTLDQRTQIIPMAPLMPGRRAVIGTSGDIYGFNHNSAIPTDQEMQYPFEGPVAERMNRRYAAAIGQAVGTASGDEEVGAAGDSASAFRGLRRFEMVPSPNPNRHQFAIRMNGLNESLSVLDTNVPGPYNGNSAFNVTGGEASGVSAGTTPNVNVDGDTLGDPTLAAAPPVIAIPIDHFSISEPLDEYLVRQIELDSGLNFWWKPNFLNRALGQGYPHEDYFSIGEGDPRRKHFDEPFDVLPELIENQTTPNYRSVHLQRLANPLLPWNPPPLRPEGQPIAQHNPSLPVNPYLPVDSRALDLTAFNSMSDLERLVPGDRGHDVVASDLVNAATPPRGPEERHRSKRNLADTLDMSNLNVATRTVIGFASNERERPFGPFPILWMMEPARLLWRQAGPSTFSEIAHTHGRSNHNGYLARHRDQLRAGSDPLDPDRQATTHDSRQIGSSMDPSAATNYTNNQFVDVAWRVTLGFADWMSGEFHTGQGLSWFNDAGATDGPIESIDLDGDRFGADLSGRPEINTAPNTQSLAANGKPAAVNGATLSGMNARDFMQSYLRAQAAEQGTTPEFAWPNRPLASAGELLQVPAWGGSRMLTYYSVFNWQYTQNPHFSRRTQVNPYDGEAEVPHDGLDYNPDTGSAGAAFDGNFANDTPADTIRDIITNVQRPNSESTNVVRFRDMLGHFGHLMNFFQTARFSASVNSYAHQTKDGVAEAAVPRGASHHYRLLDYVCVPSRFTATDAILNIDTFSSNAIYENPNDPRQEFAAPFNRIDNYREPGRVNLNTIVGRRNPNQPRDHWSEVYDGLMQRVRDDSVVVAGTPVGIIKQGHLGPAWRDVALSRRGYVQSRFNPALDPSTATGLAADAQNQVDYSPMRMHPDFPTLFANPFRAPGEGANVPLASMVQTGVDATMLRAHPLSPGADGAWGQRGVDNPAFASGTSNGNRNDAREAGVVAMQVGNSPTLNPVQRLHADTVLARFIPDPSGADTNRRGAVPDTFMDDAFRDSTGANNTTVNPRNVPPQNAVRNTEISKRSTPVPLFSGASLEPSIDTERNSTQRYLPIQRMANLATTRSNVYAVWITVGFFEVKPAREDARIAGRYFNPDGSFQTPALQELFFRVYPDGWTLGQEIGRATGEDVRHRGFYVVDRSRPVAFKPGEDANVSETVLVRRRIQ